MEESSAEGRKKTMMVFPTSLHKLPFLLLLPLALLAVLFLAVRPNQFPVFSRCDLTEPPQGTPPPPAPDFRLLVGVSTVPSKYERRHLLRALYALQQPGLTAHVDVRFVFCNVTGQDAIFVAVEIMRYDDILILNCTENMDNGKTYTYFSTVAALFNGSAAAEFDYVMKTDDDTYLRLPALVESMKNASREDMYYGLQMPCDTENFYPFPPFMSGMGYAVSWDLVQWIAASEHAAGDHDGPEDMWTGRWLNMAGKAKNRVDGAPRMYNYKGDSPSSCFRHDFIPDTIAVHMLKDDRRWAETLAYFNLTAGVKPSKLYRLP